MRLRSAFGALLATFLVAASVQAAPIVPEYDSFSAPPAYVTYSGTGIPTNPSAMTTGVSINQFGQVELYMTAHQRYSNPALTNDGEGTFYAESGSDTTLGAPADYSKWNFAFGTVVRSGNYRLVLAYDFNPAASNDRSTHGTFTFGGDLQDSWNPGFDFLTSGIPGFVMPPSYTPFDPNAKGEYTFSLSAYERDAGNFLGEANIRVCVGDGATCEGGDDVPEPASMLLMGMGLIGVGVLGRRRLRS